MTPPHKNNIRTSDVCINTLYLDRGVAATRARHAAAQKRAPGVTTRVHGGAASYGQPTRRRRKGPEQTTRGERGRRKDYVPGEHEQKNSVTAPNRVLSKHRTRMRGASRTLDELPGLITSRVAMSDNGNRQRVKLCPTNRDVSLPCLLCRRGGVLSDRTARSHFTALINRVGSLANARTQYFVRYHWSEPCKTRLRT